jgi:hypothetical protein
MVAFVILLCLMMLFLATHDLAGEWVDVVDGQKHTIYPSSVIEGDYITHSNGDDAHTIKYNFLNGTIYTTHGKKAEHHKLRRCIHWPRQRWHRIMNSKGLVNIMHDIMEHPSLIGTWYGVSDKGLPVLLNFKLNDQAPQKGHHCLYLVKAKMWRQNDVKVYDLSGEPVNDQLIKLHGPDVDDIEIYWRHTNRLTARLKNKYVHFNKLWTDDDFTL